MENRFKLYRMACRAFRRNRNMQLKWLDAVRYLREQSRCGWKLDKRIERLEIKPQQENRNVASVCI